MKTSSFLTVIVSLTLSSNLTAVENITHGNSLNDVTPPVSTLIPKIDQTENVFILVAYQDLEHQNRLAQIAIQKAPTAEVKQLVNTIIEEYSKISKELVYLSGNKSVALSELATLDQKTSEEELAKLFGAEFFAEYLEHISHQHTGMVENFEKSAISAKDPEVKAFAESNLPIVRRHQQLIKSIAQKLKVTAIDKITEL